MLMRSKWPSTEGVARHPSIPPACFTGPVCTAVTPMSENACHSDSSPSELRKLAPGAVMIEIGYAVNHTEPRSTAARGLGSAYGFCHMLPLPDNCSAINFASCRIDWLISHSTYFGLSGTGSPDCASTLAARRTDGFNGRGRAGRTARRS